VARLLGITIVGAVLRTQQGASLRAGAGPVRAFVDGYHTGLLVTIALMAAGVLVSYLTLHPRTAASGGPASERPAAGITAAGITVAGEAEGIGESLGELVVRRSSPHLGPAHGPAPDPWRNPGPAAGMTARDPGLAGS
jgi:hypothetical protein